MNTTERPAVGHETDVARLTGNPVAESLRLLVLDAVSSLGALNDPTLSRSGTRAATLILSGELTATTRSIARVLECHYGQPYAEAYQHVHNLLRAAVGEAHDRVSGWSERRELVADHVCESL